MVSCFWHYHGVVAGLKACPHQATKLPKTQQFFAENGNKLLPETATLTGASTMLPFRQQFVGVFGNFVAWCGQA